MPRCPDPRQPSLFDALPPGPVIRAGAHSE